ncbi:hypothetical protein, partial [Streptomyces sp. NPDC088357]|uniref:hypothetical protein n=1 Tax=Streptomyces sp. NPDC088357 TaxID=3154655 RepID=UPI003434B7EC
WIDADEAETLAERALRTATTAHLAAALEAFTDGGLPPPVSLPGKLPTRLRLCPRLRLRH